MTKEFCNICGYETKWVMWDGRMVCPYHQHIRQTEEGSVLMYDEFNQDGEEW